MTEDEREEKLKGILKLLSKEIEKILLETLSKEKTEWVMGDIDHVIFSHMANDINNMFE